MDFKQLTRRITGFSTPLGGMSWDTGPDPRQLAENMLDYLGDRRVLYSPYEWEVPDHCVRSVLEIREFLGEIARNEACGRELKETLGFMRGACRKFLDAAQDIATVRGPVYGIAAWEFYTALGELRAMMGIHLARIAVAYRLDIPDDLTVILPAESET